MNLFRLWEKIMKIVTTSLLPMGRVSLKLRLLFYVLMVTSFFYSVNTFGNDAASQMTEAKKEEYIQKALALGIPSKIFAESLLKERININAYEQFKKELNIDLKEFSIKTAPGLNYKELCLIADKVIIGKVVERTYDDRWEAYFKASYKIKVIDVLYGELEEKFVIIKRRSGPRNWVSIENGRPDIGRQYIFYLTRSGIELALWGKQNNIPQFANVILTDDIKNQDVYTTVANSTILVENEFAYHHGKRIKESLSLVKKNIKRIYEINNPKQFNDRIYR